jgi:hypothetical protein
MVYFLSGRNSKVFLKFYTAACNVTVYFDIFVLIFLIRKTRNYTKLHEKELTIKKSR